jgi:hypothetical protein
MATESKHPARSRWFWRILLLVLVLLPLLPEIVVLGVSTAAELTGCHFNAPPSNADLEPQVPPDPSAVARGYRPPPPAVQERSKECALGSLAASAIRLALYMGFYIGYAFGFGLSVVWLAFCYVSITRGWSRGISRLTIGLMVTLIFVFVPYFGPMIATMNLANPYCQPNESGVGPCFIYGEDVGNIVHYNVGLTYSIVTGAPSALGAFSIYALVLLIAALSSRRNAARGEARSG